MKSIKIREKMFSTWMRNQGHLKTSKPERMLFEYVCGIVNDYDVIPSDRTQMTPNDRNGWKYNHELDIWIPDLKIAIEFQGTYWHDPLRFPETLYNDIEKQLQCREKGITLV